MVGPNIKPKLYPFSQEVPEKSKESLGDPWTFCGLLPLFDPPRHDSAETIRRALNLGVDVKMITGNLSLKQISSKYFAEVSKSWYNMENFHLYTWNNAGDQLAIAKETGRRLGMGINMYPSSSLLGHNRDEHEALPADELIEKADGFAGVFPGIYIY